MTVQHSGGLHAAWLLNVCVCACVCLRVCVCEDFFKKLTCGEYQLVSAAQGVMCMSKCAVCVLMFAFFHFCATGPDCMTRTATGTATLLHIWLRVHVGWPATASESQISYSQSTSAVWERERERRWDRRGGEEKERAEVSISLSIRLSACHFGQLCRHPVRSDSLSFELFWTGSPPTAAAAQETWMKQTRVKKRGWWGT